MPWRGLGVSETKEHRICLPFHARSFPYVPFALLPIHHISLWARQLSEAEAYSQFSSPSNCTKYSNSSVKLGQGVERWEAKCVKEAGPCWWTLPTLTLLKWALHSEHALIILYYIPAGCHGQFLQNTNKKKFDEANFLYLILKDAYRTVAGLHSCFSYFYNETDLKWLLLITF